jgi:hypothetical protein
MELMLARGATRLAKNKTSRDTHVLDITVGCRDGPSEYKHAFTRERADRPLVRKYNEAVGHRENPADVTAREVSKYGSEMLRSSLARASLDRDDLSATGRALSATLHDRTRVVEVERDVRHFRARGSPTKRL